MLKRLFNSCRRGEKCITTVEEDNERISKVLEDSKYDISHYTSSHPLYEYYNNIVIEKSDMFSKVLCRGEVTPGYISSTQENNKVAIILTIARGYEDGIQYQGFAQSFINTLGELYIFTICTLTGLGLGERIINSIETFIRKNKVKINTIIVDSIEDSTRFYEKIGFEMIDVNEAETLYKMEKKVGGSRKKRIIKTRRKRKSPRIV